jgi:hypothetical protein
VLPTFLVIGAKKGGSTSLHQYLSTHPDVFMPAGKRLEFFSGHNWDRGLGWYRAQFEAGGAALARGEASNVYTNYPVTDGVPERIAAVVPDIKLVYVIRHPLERILSHYRQAVAEWGETRSADEVVQTNGPEYVMASCYALQIERYLAHFRREQLLVVTSEDLRHSRRATLVRVFDHLGVDPDWVPPNVDTAFNRAGDYRYQPGPVQRMRHAGAYRAVRRWIPKRAREAVWRASTRPLAHDPAALRLSTNVEADVLARLRPDLTKLRTILGDDFHCWGLLT